MSFFAELKRRKVFRVAAAYAIVAWLLIQVSSTTFPQLQLPEWAPTLVTVLLLIGFPIALLLAWAFDLTPEGVRLTDGVTAGVAVESRQYRGLGYLLIVGLLLMVAVTLWVRLAPGKPETASQAPAIAASPSVAVLPFVDMSPNGDQAYFGDGIAEELLNELTRLEGLRVAGRTSSFAWKNSQESLQAIGAALNVDSILEGSVRKDGERIRVTAQLVKVEDGYHLWSQTYDRELKDIFSIQDEIATTVAGELGVRLGVGGVNSFKGAGTRNIQAYEAYLQGNALIGRDNRSATALFERAVELDPDYGAAWSGRGVATASRMWSSLPREAPAILEEAVVYVRRAVELNPDSALARAQLGTITYALFDWIGGHEAQVGGLRILADRRLLEHHGNLLMRAGRLNAARAQYAAAELAEPMGGQPLPLSYFVSVGQGRWDEVRDFKPWRPEAGQKYLELLVLLNGADAAATKAALVAFIEASGDTGPDGRLMRALLDAFDEPAKALTVLHAAYADGSEQWPEKLNTIALWAAYFDDPELALAALGDETRFTVVRIGVIWFPVMAEVRRLPGFKQLVTDIGLLPYWRQYGWADQCGPLGETDFSCG